MTILFILFLIIWLVTLLGWLTESIYRKLLLKSIRKKITGKIEWLTKAHGDYEREKQAYMDALSIIDKEVKGK